MMLAVYQFNAYCRLLSKSQDEMPFKEAKSTAEQFFKNLTPWERVQLHSVALAAELIVSVRRIGKSTSPPDRSVLHQKTKLTCETDRNGLLSHERGDEVEPKMSPM
jgi:hypothetical protein